MSIESRLLDRMRALMRTKHTASAPRRPKRLPVVLTRDEVRTLLGNMRGTTQLVARLLVAEGFGDVWLPGAIRRHHLGPHLVQRAVQQAVAVAGIAKQIGPHTQRHSLATTTMIYTHVLGLGANAVRSPLDALAD